MTRAARIARSRRPVTPRAPTATELEAALKAKFDRLAALKAQIASLKGLYEQHDALTQELMGMFITRDTDGSWKVKTSLTIGNKTYRFSPAFFDEKKSSLTAKNWKSGAYPVGTIQS